MKAYLYQNNLDSLLASSSGGAFSRIVKKTIDIYKDVVIYGAAWDSELRVAHIRIEDYSEIRRLSGSKYARSNMGESLTTIQRDIEDGHFVVFSGTPCQVAAVKSYLSKKHIDKAKYLLIDIICHGTPSPIILKDWISWIEKKYNNQIIDISFRDKNISWEGYPTTITFKDGKKLSYTYDSQQFMRLFFSHLIMSESCFECPYSNLNRLSDITIGDYWGVKDIYPEIHSEKGVSLVLANSTLGDEIIEKIIDERLSDEIVFSSCDEYIKYQHNLNSPTDKPEEYERFWADYFEHGYNYVLHKYRIHKVKDAAKAWVKERIIKRRKR